MVTSLKQPRLYHSGHLDIEESMVQNLQDLQGASPRRLESETTMPVHNKDHGPTQNPPKYPIHLPIIMHNRHFPFASHPRPVSPLQFNPHAFLPCRAQSTAFSNYQGEDIIYRRRTCRPRFWRGELRTKSESPKEDVFGCLGSRLRIPVVYKPGAADDDLFDKKFQ